MNKEISSDIHYSKDSDRNRETNGEDIEDDEDPRLAKQRKLYSGPAYKALIPPSNDNLEAGLRQRHYITLPSATQLEVGNTQS
jgi:hypothetical protein